MSNQTTTATIASVIAALAGISITAAAAQERGDRDGPFADGVLTRAEASEMALARFDRVDANEDGFVSKIEREEAREAAEARRAERAESRDGERQRRGRRGGRRGQGGERDDRSDRMDLTDTNDDGFLSRDEALDAALARFDAADADGDGELTRDELRARLRARSGERGGRR